jgi:hypothetical protein
MKIAFTLCSLNYLPQAKVLGDSLLAHNTDYTFLIGLVDRLDQMPDRVRQFSPYEIVEIEALQLDGFAEMCQHYHIVELNTAVKPGFFEYLFKRYPGAEFIVYLDPDIYFFNNLSHLEEVMLKHSIALTPHYLSPIKQFTKINEFKPFSLANNFDYYEERHALYTGTYNLGFIALKNDAEGLACTQWWGERLRHQCYIGGPKGLYGLFVDQNWMNLAPVYFPNTYTIRHLGYNASSWNLHERTFTKENGRFMVDANYPLVFFHFSGFLIDGPRFTNWLGKTFDDYPSLQPIYELYRAELNTNRFADFRKIKCYFVERKQRQEIETEQLRLAQLPRYRRVGGRLLKALWSLLPGFAQRLSKSLLQFLLAKVNEFEAAAKVASK